MSYNYFSCAHTFSVMTILTFSSVTSSPSTAIFTAYETKFSLPGLNHDKYSILGDINIGSLMSVTKTPNGFVCSKDVRSDMWVWQNMEAVAFAIQMVNNDSNLLPNVSLGFVILDYCRTPNIALAQSLSFLPVEARNADSTICTSSGSTNPQNSTDDSYQNLTTSAPESSPSSFHAMEHHEVVGALGPQGSSSTVAMSSLFSVAKLPVVSYMSTSDELSNKHIHPFFMRVIPPDKHQTLAMLTFIQENNWSYISVVYGANSYGEKAYYNIRQLSPRFRICVATAHSVTAQTNFHRVLQNLRDYENARVVILFMETDPALQLFSACERAGVKGHFIWIASDAISDKAILRRQFAEQLHGAFTFIYYSKRVPEFEDYFRKLRPGLSLNPWFNSYWEFQANCSFKTGSCLSEESIRKFEQLIISSTVSLVFDSVLTFAHAIHRLLNETCPGITGRDARACIEGDLLLQYMRNSSFEGFTSTISFDEFGDLIGKYEIRQLSWKSETLTYNSSNSKGVLIEAPIAYFEAHSGNIEFTGRPISWSHLKVMPGIIDSFHNSQVTDPPESICSRPCAIGESKIQRELPCCWECHRCRDNERLINKNTACQTCDKFTWPDPDTNFTTCLPIPLTFPSLSDTVSIIEVCAATVAIIAQGFVAAVYICFRGHRAIKAASRELSFLQMVAMFVGYITVILFQTTPTDLTCGAIYFMFCLSFTWLYSPLIVKAVRIYRIFTTSSKCNRRPRFVSPQSQIIIAGILITIQVCVSFFLKLETQGFFFLETYD